MKNYFYFTLKALLVLSRYLNFCSKFSFMSKNGLIRKTRLISKFMTSQPGQQTIAIHILPNISGSKGNQATKFSQSIQHNMRNIFLEKSYTKCGEDNIPRPFLKNRNWAYLWINSLKFYNVRFFLLYAKLRAIEIYWN